MPAQALRIVLTSGRLRAWRHAALVVLGGYGVWAWFGGAGVVPWVIWAWQCRPRVGTRHCLEIDRVVAVQCGQLRTWVRPAGGAPCEIFSDEMPRPELAALRRELKRRCSTRDGAQDIQPI